LLVERRGTPPAVQLSAANQHDSTGFDTLLDAVEPVRQARGRPRKRPAKLHADKGYDYRKCRLALRKRGIKARIARRGGASSQRLGRHRWVVERTFAWLSRFRRLRVRYERRDDIHLALTKLACALITFRAVKRFC
jgi:IS5 family transposase